VFLSSAVLCQVDFVSSFVSCIGVAVHNFEIVDCHAN